MSELKEIKDLLNKINIIINKLENKREEVYHEGLIWLPIHETKMTWQEAIDYANSTGARLPKPSEFLHAYETGFKFEGMWFWSVSQHYHQNYSFVFGGSSGNVLDSHQSYKGGVRCVVDVTK